MPHRDAQDRDALLIGFYLEKGFEADHPSLGHAPYLRMDDRWDWHRFELDPEAFDRVLQKTRCAGGPLAVLLRTRRGTHQYQFDQALSHLAFEPDPHSDAAVAPDFAHCAYARTLAQLLQVIRNTPDNQRGYLDLIIGHTYPTGESTQRTAAQIYQRSMRPWVNVILGEPLQP